MYRPDSTSALHRLLAHIPADHQADVAAAAARFGTRYARVCAVQAHAGGFEDPASTWPADDARSELVAAIIRAAGPGTEAADVARLEALAFAREVRNEAHSNAWACPVCAGDRERHHRQHSALLPG